MKILVFSAAWVATTILCSIIVLSAAMIYRDQKKMQRVRCGDITMSVQVDKEYPDSIVCKMVCERMQCQK